MKKNKAAFISFVYIENAQYLKEFLRSISEQSYSNFDIILFNDGFENFRRFISGFSLNFTEVKISGTHAFIRQEAINYLIDKGYKEIIFGDSDDYFEKNRVETALALLENFDIVVNDYHVVNNNGVCVSPYYLSQRLGNKSIIRSEMVAESNIMGFTNTALKIKNRDAFYFNDNLIAVDWYFFSKCLLNGYKAVFTNETTSFYRQHDSNIIGALNVSPDRIVRAVSAKFYHYKEMVKLDSNYIPYLENFEKLNNKIAENKDDFIMKYSGIVNSQMVSNPFWWENIKSLEEIK